MSPGNLLNDCQLQDLWPTSSLVSKHEPAAALSVRMLRSTWLQLRPQLPAKTCGSTVQDASVWNLTAAEARVHCSKDVRAVQMSLTR